MERASPPVLKNIEQLASQLFQDKQNRLLPEKNGLQVTTSKSFRQKTRTSLSKESLYRTLVQLLKNLIKKM